MKNSYFFIAPLVCLLLVGGSITNSLIAQSTGTLQTDGETYRYGYSGGNEKYRDFTIPSNYDPNTEFNQITFALRGGDGGRRRVQGICTEPGGKGARVDASFEIGYGEGKLKPGGTIRIIVGEQGRSLKSGGLAGAGGGGGSAILYSDPDLDGNACKEEDFNIASSEWDTTCWIILAVAGGGGGAYASGGCAQPSSGKPGNGGSNGTDGKGATAGAGGTNGKGGDIGDGYGSAGGGYRPIIGASVASGHYGALDGGNGGSSDGEAPGFYVRGGYGFGGGGAGLRTFLIVRGGGGGGYSGGGYGSQYEGGGGGGSFANSHATSFDKRDGNGTDRTPNNGYVSYFLNNNSDLADAPNAVCQDTTVYIIGEEQTINAAEVAFNSTDPNGRPLTYCFDFGDVCSPNIGFDCFDLGDEEVYTVRVDNGLNSSTCTVNLEIQQGTPGNLDCPGAQTISVTDCDGILINGQTNPGEGQLFFAPFEFPTCEYSLGYYIQRPDGSLDTNHLNDHATTGIQIDTFQLGTSLVVYTVGYEDEEGIEQAQTCVTRITVTGQENYSINCPNNIDINIPNGDIDPENPCNFLVEHGIGPGAYDLTPNVNGCGDLNYTITHPDISTPTVVSGTGELDEYNFPVGISTVEYTLERLPGELYTCSFTVEINQNTQPPTISNCPTGDVSINIFEGITTEEILEQISFDVDDDCGIASITLENLDLSCAEVGEVQDNVRIRVTDTDGGSDFCNIDVRTVQEKFIVCPGDIVVSTEEGFCFATIAEEMLAPTAAPVCPFNYSYSVVDLENNMSVASGGGNIPEQLLSAGQYRAGYVWQNGIYLNSCNFYITIVDEEAPEIVCQDATVNLSELPSNPADLLFVSATDDCSTTFTASTDESYDCYNLGFNTVIVTVTDESGNESVCGAILNIIDDVPPVITACPADRTVTLDANCEATLPDLTGEIMGTSNCGTATASQFPEAGTLLTAGDGVIEVTVNLVKENGQEAATPCTVQITVPDDAPPTAVCQDITVNLVGNSQSITAGDIDNGSSDDCSTLGLSLDQTTFTCGDVGSNTVTLTITDSAEQSASCTATVLVQDNIAPTALCQNVTVQLNASGQGTISSEDVDNGSSDACGLNPLALSQTEFDCTDVGINSVTLTATDNNGNSSSCTASVNVQDNMAPTALCQNVTVQLDASGNASTTATAVDNGSNDACGIASLALSQTEFDCTDVGINSVTLTATDSNGNSSTCTASVNVQDNIAPTALCQNLTLYLDESGMASIPITIGTNAVDNGSSDNCGIASFALGQTDFDCSDVGNNLVMLTVTDVNGNVGDCMANIMVQDNVPPTVICQDVTVQLDANGSATLFNALFETSVMDNCGVSTYGSVNPSSVDCSQAGQVIPVTVTRRDVNDNLGSCNANVTVQDNMAPSAVCQNLTVQLDANGDASTTGNDVDNGSSDNCGIASLVLDQTSFECDDVGDNTVNLTVTDVNGNVSSCSGTVTVEDNIAPTAICQNVTLQLDGNGQASTTAEAVNNDSYDNCGIVSISLDQTTFDCSNPDQLSATLTVTDVNNNSSSCNTIIYLEDNAPPTALCQNLTLQLDGNGYATIPIAMGTNAVDNGSNDNCSIVSYSLDQKTFDCDEVGDNTVTLTVTDQSDNSNSCNATITVEDNLVPTALCQNLTLQLDANGNAATSADEVGGSSFDNCDIASMDLNQTSFDCSHVGSNTVTLTVNDVNGNTNNCTATITVEDNISPTALCQNLTLQLDVSGNASTTAMNADDGSFDNCGIASISLGQTAFDCSDVGTNAITLTVTDVNSNTNSCTSIITVEDNVSPSITQCDGLTAVFNGEDEFSTASVISFSATDACGIVSTTYSPNVITCDQLGQTIPVTVTVIDQNGNSNSCTAFIDIDGLPCGFIDFGDDGIDCEDSSNVEYDSQTGTFTLESDGCYSTNFAQDNAAYTYAELCGDGEIIAHVSSITPLGQGWAGITLRESEAPGAKKVELLSNLSNMLRRAIRTTTNGYAYPAQFFRPQATWLKLVRTGNIFAGYASFDGINWQNVLYASIPMNNCIQAGLLVTNYSGLTLVTATFDNVTVNGAGSGLNLQVPDTEGQQVDQSEDLDFMLFPNPVKDQLYVDMINYQEQEVTIEILNQLGQSVLKKHFAPFGESLINFELNELSSGTYFVRLIAGNAEKVKQFLMVK